MKYIKYITVIAFMAALLGCAPAMSFNSGAVVGVDSSGHFVKDLTYNYGTSTLQFLKDGSFVITTRSYEEATEDWDSDSVSNEGWVQSSGDKGTYVYDADTRLMTYTFTHKFRTPSASTGAMVWDLPTNNNDTIKETETAVFTEEDLYTAYNFDQGNTWIRTTTTDKKNGTSTANTYTYGIDPDNNSITYYTVYANYSNNVQLSGNRYYYTYSIQGMYPAGDKWEKGKTITFDCYRTYYYYNSSYDGTNWAVYAGTNNNQSSSLRYYSHAGDYIIFNPTLLPVAND